MSLAREMWDYLKTIGFEDVPDNDNLWESEWGLDLHIAKGRLCAHQSIESIETDNWIFLP